MASRREFHQVSDWLNKVGRSQSLDEDMEVGFLGPREEEEDMIERKGFFRPAVEGNGHHVDLGWGSIRPGGGLPYRKNSNTG